MIKVIFALMVLVVMAFAESLQNHFLNFFKKKCYEISFIQENFFLKKNEAYKGKLIKKGNSINITYYTNPIFYIKSENDYILLGYKGRTPTIYEKRRISNPILKVLLYLDKIQNYFYIVSCEVSLCILKPKGKLKRYIKEVDIVLKNQTPSVISIKGKINNDVLILIKNFNPFCY